MKRWPHYVTRACAVGLVAGSLALAIHFASAQRSVTPTGAGSGSDGSGSAVPLTPDQQTIADAVAAGTHWRVEGPRGPIHVWRPAGYHTDGAATILYCHGYYVDADTAWLKYQLPEQFAMAGANALFIAPEVPNGNRQPIQYPDLVEILQLVERATGLPRGTGPVVAMGHSGAYRTLVAWMDAPLLDTIIAFDAMYGSNDDFQTWYEGAPNRRLITVADDTLPWTEDIALDVADTYTVDMLPTAYDRWPAGALAARHLYIRAQFGHMSLVTGGRAIPLLLRLLPVETLATAPWQIPLGSLPPPPVLGSGSGSAKP